MAIRMSAASPTLPLLLERRLRRELAALFLRHGVSGWRLERAGWHLAAGEGPVLELARALLRRRLRAWGCRGD
jgi:hypothetical protein